MKSQNIYLEPWEVDSKSFPQKAPLKDQLMFLCRYGILAPSVHNTQPWLFEVFDDKIIVNLSTTRTLSAGDETSRESWISIGACVQNIIIAGEYFGLFGKVDVAAFARTDHPSQVAILFTKKKQKKHSLILKALTQRFSDRSIYDGSPLKAPQLKKIQECYKSSMVEIKVSNTAETINLAAELTQKGIEAALSNPGFRQELASFIHYAPNQGTGFTAEALNIRGLKGLLERYRVANGLFRKQQGIEEFKRIKSASALICVFTKGDTPLYWLEAGRAYEQAAVYSTMLGLRTATTAAAVEAFDFHLDIEKAFKTHNRLQILMRVGKSQKPIYLSPRLPLQQVVK